MSIERFRRAVNKALYDHGEWVLSARYYRLPEEACEHLANASIASEKAVVAIYEAALSAGPPPAVLREALQRVEWSTTKGGGTGTVHEVCPECWGTKYNNFLGCDEDDKPVYEKGHRPDCFLAKALGVPVSPNGEWPPESRCQRCGGPNVVWSAPNDLWNHVMGSAAGIVCPVCFVREAERIQVRGPWLVAPVPMGVILEALGAAEEWAAGYPLGGQASAADTYAASDVGMKCQTVRAALRASPPLQQRIP